MPRLPGDEPIELWCQLCSGRGASPGDSYCDQCRLLRPRYLDVVSAGDGSASDLAEAPAMKGVRAGWSAFEYVLIATLLVAAMVLLASGR